MTAFRFQVHPESGRWAFKATDGYPLWTVLEPDGAIGQALPDAAMTAQQGWELAVLVVLPEPVVTERVCGCGRAPDGAPQTEGCSAECMAPAVVTFDERVHLDVQAGEVSTLGDALTLADAEREAAALLAAANWGADR